MELKEGDSFDSNPEGTALSARRTHVEGIYGVYEVLFTPLTKDSRSSKILSPPNFISSYYFP